MSLGAAAIILKRNDAKILKFSHKHVKSMRDGPRFASFCFKSKFVLGVHTYFDVLCSRNLFAVVGNGSNPPPPPRVG
jgi:hypothetical protein